MWLVSHINPEPWAIGSVSHGRMSPNLTLASYKRAVKEEFEDVGMLDPSWNKITFYFYRQLATYLDFNDKKRHRNQADATNMQKALEDALQGVLYGNDRDVRDIRSVIMEQGPEVKNPGTIICIEQPSLAPSVPMEVLNRLNVERSAPVMEDWTQGDDLF